MINNPRRERGAMALSVVGSLLLFAFVIIFAGKLVPVYLEHGSVKSMLASFEKNTTVEMHSPSALRNRILQQLRINSVTHVAIGDVSVVRGRNSFEVDISYQAKLPLIRNIELLLSFSDQAEIPFN